MVEATTQTVGLVVGLSTTALAAETGPMAPLIGGGADFATTNATREFITAADHTPGNMRPVVMAKGQPDVPLAL